MSGYLELMSNIEEERQDTDSALPATPPPATAERKRPAWVMIALLVVLAIAVAIILMSVIPNGGVMS
ncbi:MAG TPA: hypothetical protein VL595_14600 [Pseudonocardia sp.]|nr:hypothetical protein [Pseudonocardia sp.]